jgi:signal transduction histidine kinase
MRLHEFITQNMETILQEWENFARSIEPEHSAMTLVELRDHAEKMLRAMALDMQAPQTELQREDKSKGRQLPAAGESAAESHGSERLSAGFTIDLLFAEYRALRASVLKLWTQENLPMGPEHAEDIIRFNEAIDQAATESIKRYSEAVTMAQDVFIGILGHDLRTPLQSISLGAQRLMHDDQLDSSLIKLGARMHKSVRRMTGMVDNLLDFTRSRIGGGIQIERAFCDLNDVVEQVVDEFRSYHPGKSIRRVTKGDCKGQWDPGRIAQVYQNLIANALQYGDPEKPVIVSSECDGGEAVIRVHNSGPVISPQDQKRLFNLLHRHASAAMEGNSRGNLGLGLYIVAEVVAAHGGTVEVSSTESRGTEFVVKLPRQVDSAAGMPSVH